VRLLVATEEQCYGPHWLRDNDNDERRAWNSLPAATQDLSSSSSCFYSRVKTELFTRAYGVDSL